MRLDLLAVKDRVARNLISEQKHPTLDLFVYNYTHKVQFDGLWDEWTRSCRGLIADRNGVVIANPFPKFHNLGEVEETKPENLPAEVPEVEEKLDGSLGILYFDGDQPSIATRGSFTSPQALWATSWLRAKGLESTDFLPGMTYLFEIIYSENRIVVDYKGRAELVLLAVRETATGREAAREEEAARLGFSSPKLYRMSRIDETGPFLASVPGLDMEGFVVRYSSGLRLKVKSEDYKRLHRIMTGTSTIAIWEVLSAGEKLDALLESVPDEFFRWLRVEVDALNGAFAELMTQGHTALESVRGLPTRKEQALRLIQEHPRVRGIAFKLLDGDAPGAVLIAWKMIRPHGGQTFRSVGEDV